jgi:hypothetical protein
MTTNRPGTTLCRNRRRSGERLVADGVAQRHGGLSNFGIGKDGGVIPIDHLMMGVADFGASAARWESDHGLTTLAGIRFEDAPGFANAVVPLGETWIELVGVAADEADVSDPRVQMFSQVVSGGDLLMGWALAPEDLEAVAHRLGLAVSEQHATHAVTGEAFTWRQVGFDETRMHPYLPFFVGWDDDVHAEMARSTAEVGNAHAQQAGVRLELTGDPSRLEQWLGTLEAPVTIMHGRPSITAYIETDRGTLTVR